MGDPALDDKFTDDQPQPAEASPLPEDVVEQILRYLSAVQALRCGRVSRYFCRASIASLGDASCEHGIVGCGIHCCCCCWSNGGGSGSGSGGNVSRPYLDLREGGDAVDCRALSSLLRRMFSKSEDSQSTAADGTGSDDFQFLAPSPAASSVNGRPTTLKGLALRSSAIRDAGIEEALELCGEDLEALNLADCRYLDASLTMVSMRQWCNRLASLDVSGTAFEEGGGEGGGENIPSPATPPTFPTWSQPLELGNIFGGGGSGHGSEGARSSPQEKVDGLQDCDLVMLLSGGLGRGLLSLRLRDRPFITDEGIGVIASCCTQLRELDVGLSQTGKITGQGLLYLSAAPCAQSLASLGLRNRHSVGHLDLEALGTQFPGLRKLDLADLVKVDDDVLKALVWTLSLTHIDLSRAHHVSVAGVVALALGSPELECISLHGIALTDGAVRALCGACPRLRHINVSMTCVTEQSLRLLAAKDSLRWANIRCCGDMKDSAATSEVLAAFRRRLAAPTHPRDRGTVLGMERPEPQQRARAPPPKRSLRPCLDGGGSTGRRSPPTGREAQASSNYHGQGAPVRTQSLAAKNLFREGSGTDGAGSGDTGDARDHCAALSRSDGSLNVDGGHVCSDGRSDGGSAMDRNQVAPLWGKDGGDGDEALAARAAGEKSSGGPNQWMSSTPFSIPLVSSVLSSGLGAWIKGEKEKGKGGQAALVRNGVKDPESAAGSPSPAAPVARSIPPAQPAASPNTESPAAESPAGESPAPALAAPAPAHALASSRPPAADAPSAAQPASPPAVAAMPPTSSSGDRPLPLLPAGVGDLSLGQSRRRIAAQRRTPGEGRNSSRAHGTMQEHPTGAEAGDEAWGPRGEDGTRGRGQGVGGESNLEGGVVVPFDWDNIPRGSGVGDLGGWKGFRGLSGDLVKNVIRELHPYAEVAFRAKHDPEVGPPTPKISHGYLVHTSKWGQAWVELEVDDQGCVT